MLISECVRESALSSHNGLLGVVHVEHYTKLQSVESLDLYVIYEISTGNIKYTCTIRY